MSYCVFENTAPDLRQCVDKLEQGRAGDWHAEEQYAARAVVKLAHEIAARWSVEDVAEMIECADTGDDDDASA